MSNSGSKIAVSLIVFALVAVGCWCASTSGSNGNHSFNYDPSFCQSIDIRHHLNALRKLQSCRRIEGFLKILFLDFGSDTNRTAKTPTTLTTSPASATFPNLLSISGYLLIYRVSGLRTLRHLFPNLMAIRGENLLFGNSLILFEVPDLQEIGLVSLRAILKGSVYIDRNPMLCYATTINWSHIMRSDMTSVHKIKQKSHECSACPNFERSDCLTSTTNETQKSESVIRQNFCWNHEKCQKVCPAKCNYSGCIANTCCHATCLGGCSGPARSDCFLCRHLFLPSRNECVETCPNGTFNFMNSRCISAQECYSLAKKNPYIPFGGVCSTSCPLDYERVALDARNRFGCVPCRGLCSKTCTGGVINKIDDSEKYFRCTHINGSLEIAIRSGTRIFEVLEKNLGLIHRIDGYLKIVRSFALKSLMFFRSLNAIVGNQLENNLYSLTVYDNQNLEELWIWPQSRTGTDNKTALTLHNGTVFFHFNPKLCLNKIREFLQAIRVNESDVTAINISPNTNGDKASCALVTLNVTTKSIGSASVTIEWLPFETRDYRNLLGYRIYMIPAPFRNVSLLDSRNPCGNSAWHIDDVLSSHSESDPGTKPIRYSLGNLKAFTQYAFYVSTSMISNENRGGQSELIYFKTRPDKPSEVRKLTIVANSSELFLKWHRPKLPNGDVTHYKVTIRHHADNMERINKQNFCLQYAVESGDGQNEDGAKSLRAQIVSNRKSHESRNLTGVSGGSNGGARSSASGGSNTDIESSESDYFFTIDFENQLHNSIFFKRKHRRRSVPDDINDNNDKRDDDDNNSDNKSPNTEAESFIVPNRTNFTIRNLLPYAKYSIEIEACRERVDRFDTKPGNNCSRKVSQTIRTRKQPAYDHVTFSRIEVEQNPPHLSNAVRLWWPEPEFCNGGVIVAYQVEYKNIDIDQMKPIVECIPHEQYSKNNGSYELKQLVSGHYRIRLLAVTIAGPGPYSDYAYFVTSSSTSAKSLVFVTLAALFCFLITATILFSIFTKRYLRSKLKRAPLMMSVNANYSPVCYVFDEWEVERKNVQLVRELGSGNFGIVYEGVLTSPSFGSKIRCAIKTIRENDAFCKSEILHEANIMKKFDCYHVVRLLGIVSVSDPVLVLIELMENGDLKTYLIEKQKWGNVDKRDRLKPLDRLYRMAIEIADGMHYLSTNRFVHRDLAARNCMISTDLVVKIGDFGLSKDTYEEDYYRHAGQSLLPIRWMAPESLLKGTYSYASDVWSYGIVLWEIVTAGNLPYTGLDIQSVIERVTNGYLLAQPANCPDSLYDLMRIAWNYKPDERPTFADIIRLLLPFIANSNNNDNCDFFRVSYFQLPK